MGNECSAVCKQSNNTILPIVPSIINEKKCPLIVISSQNQSIHTAAPVGDVAPTKWNKSTWYVPHQWTDLIPLIPVIQRSLQSIGTSVAYQQAQSGNTSIISPSLFLSHTFYESVFLMIPNSRRMFSRSIETQGEMLQSLLTMLLDLLRTNTPESLKEMVRQVQDLVEFHNAYRITLSQYVVVGEALIDALEHCCGTENWTVEIAHAWYMLYSALLDIIADVIHHSKSDTILPSTTIAHFLPPQ